MAEPEIRSGVAESSMPPVYAIAAAFAAIIPAAGTLLATRGVINAFRGMAVTGSGGIGAISAGLYEANQPVIISAVAGAALAGWLAFVALRKPQVSPGLLLSVVALAACAPALILWSVEGLSIDVLTGDATGSVAEISQRISFLLIASAGGAFLLVVVAFAALGISLARRRPRSADPALPPAAVWAATTVLFLVLAVLFYARSSVFHEAAVTGKL